MATVKNKDTNPELIVRSHLFRAGYRYRLHAKALPGSPDIVLPRYRAAVFVHGCFWHGHTCSRGRRPQTNCDFWDSKLNQNIARDKGNQEALAQAEWRVFVVWTCQIDHDTDQLLTYLDEQRNRNGISGSSHSELS